MTVNITAYYTERNPKYHQPVPPLLTFPPCARNQPGALLGLPIGLAFQATHD
jgi:hypothetical protein